MDNFDLLASEAAQSFGLQISPTQLQALQKYADLLAVWNQKFNLTAITDPDEIRLKHFLDSLSCQLVLDKLTPTSLIDVGTGAGFPGLPLKLLHPEMALTLVESVAKKTQFLEQVVQDLGLDGVEILNQRAEETGQDSAHRQKYDWAAARAVAGLPTLAEYLLPLVHVGGYMLAQKGESAPQEVEQARATLETLGGEMDELLEVRLPGIDEKRYLVVVKKVKDTPDKYPRRVGIPAKRPIG